MNDIRLVVTADGSPGPATDLLLQDLRNGARADVRPAPGQATAGSKSGTGVTLGELIVAGAFSASTVKAIASVIVANIKRGSARKITMRSGETELSVEGADAANQQAAIERWLNAHANADSEN